MFLRKVENALKYKKEIVVGCAHGDVEVPCLLSLSEANIIVARALHVVFSGCPQCMPAFEEKMKFAQRFPIPRDKISSQNLAPLLASLGQDVEDAPFALVSCNDNCTFCLVCIRHCFPKAMREESGKLVFSHEKCVACMRCVEVCPEKALGIKKGFYHEYVGKAIILKEKETILCKICGAELPSLKKRLERIERIGINTEYLSLCPDCRLKSLQKVF